MNNIFGRTLIFASGVGLFSFFLTTAVGSGLTLVKKYDPITPEKMFAWSVLTLGVLHTTYTDIVLESFDYVVDFICNNRRIVERDI